MDETRLGQIKELRRRTGARITDCRRALELTQGDVEAAAKRLIVVDAWDPEERRRFWEQFKRPGRERRQSRLATHRG